MTVSIIVAVGADGAIGRAGDLAFHISADLKRFKAITTGHTVVMGRRTFESLPKGALPNRRNIVVTRTEGFSAPGIETAASLDEALALAAADGEVFVIGGASVYAQALPLASRLYLTEIEACCKGADTFFPTFDRADWHTIDATDIAADERTGLHYRFVTLQKKS